MIGRAALLRKSHFASLRSHGNVRKNHNAARFPPPGRRRSLRRFAHWLTRSFRRRIPQPPAPRGRQDRVYFFLLLPHLVGFRSGTRLEGPLSPALLFCLHESHDLAAPAPSDVLQDKYREMSDRIGWRARISWQATCRPPLTSGPACRGCRPAHRPRRHRRPRAKCSPAALTMCSPYRPNRRP